MRTVHRLEQVACKLPGIKPVGEIRTAAPLLSESAQGIRRDDGRILGLAIVRKVPRGPVEIQLADMRRENLRVALLAQLLADEILQLLPHHASSRGPQHQTLSNHLVDVEQLQVLSELAMVTCTRFLQQRLTG